ncbi:MAG: gamma-glutamyltransferase family protein [Advenella sp.]
MRSVQQITKSSAQGDKIAIACARSLSCDAATKMIDIGGNAVDAAIAAAFVAGVIEPMETTLAGSGFMLIQIPGQSEAVSIEFGPRAPLAATPEMFELDHDRKIDRGLGVSVVKNDANVQGARAAGVPATIRGLADAQEKYGRLTLSQVMQPAIRAAYDGFEIDNYYSLETLANLEALRLDPGASAVFLENGLPPCAPHLGSATLGEKKLLRQAALGKSLEHIAAKGADVFYKGEVGRAFLQTVSDLGGILTAADLAQCETKISPARSLRFRDTDIWVPTAPCGAITQLQILAIWQALYPEGGPQIDTPDRIRDFANACWHAFADRYHWLGDPDFVAVPEAGLTAIDYAAFIAQQIRNGAPLLEPDNFNELPWEFYAKHAAHDPWAYDADTKKQNQWAPAGSTAPPAGTTHVSVIDADGMAVAITHTAANHFGSKVVCPRTGFLLDAAMGWFNAVPGAANSIAPGKRPLANMAPMLLTRNGSGMAALGAPGGRRIIAAVAQIAINLVERQMNAAQATQAPRYDASGSTLLLSERFTSIQSELPEYAEKIRFVSEQHEGFGYELARPNIAIRTSDGRVQAAADPFSKGYAYAV